jgi:hypothetical protein
MAALAAYAAITEDEEPTALGMAAE